MKVFLQQIRFLSLSLSVHDINVTARYKIRCLNVNPAVWSSGKIPALGVQILAGDPRFEPGWGPFLFLFG